MSTPQKRNFFAMLELGLPIFPVKIEKGLPFLSMWYNGLIDFMKVSLWVDIHPTWQLNG